MAKEKAATILRTTPCVEKRRFAQLLFINTFIKDSVRPMGWHHSKK